MQRHVHIPKCDLWFWLMLCEISLSHGVSTTNGVRWAHPWQSMSGNTEKVNRVNKSCRALGNNYWRIDKLHTIIQHITIIHRTSRTIQTQQRKWERKCTTFLSQGGSFLWRENNKTLQIFWENHEKKSENSLGTRSCQVYGNFHSMFKGIGHDAEKLIKAMLH